MDEVPGWEAGPHAGFDESAKFLSNLIEDSHELLLIFAALVQAWQKQAFPNAEMPYEEIVTKMTGRYKPQLNDLFFAKG